MGSPKARSSALAVVADLELLYLGCFMFVLLRVPLRPANYIDVFRCADSEASLLQPRMIFAIANDSRPTEPLNMVATGNENLWTGSRKINDNSTKRMSLDYSRSYISLPTPLNHSTFTIAKPVWGPLHDGLGVVGIDVKGEKDVGHIFDPRKRCWYMDTTLKQETLEEALNTTSFQEKIEEDEELREFDFSLQEGSKLFYDALLNHRLKVILKHSELNDTACCGRCDIDKASNNDRKYTMKVVFITFGSTTLVFLIFLLSWKHIKNSTYSIDHTLYEMLLKEAILISSGSSGKVYKIKFLNLECAMKVFSSHTRMDFRRELIVANLDHPNIIKFFCCFRKSFIIMELMSEDLYSYIEKIREKTSDYELSLELALDVMLQIAKGMSYLHEEGIAHQDLKSLNIFVKLQGEPHSSNFRIIAKIADFGSARSFDPRYPQGFFLRPMENVGTRSWRAPELFPPRGGFLTKDFDMACEILPKPLDIYGFAIICSELLTKQIPFSFTNEPRIVQGDELRAGLRPTLPSRDCPKELIALIEDCWHSNPKSRPEFREICTRLSQLIEVQTPSTL